MLNKVTVLASSLGATGLLRQQKKNSVTVLSLHRVTPNRDYFFDPLDPVLFEEMIKYCIKHYNITTCSEINIRSKKPNLILSFDDGYYDFVEYAMPVLHKYNIPCNHNFVNVCLNNNDVIWGQEINDLLTYCKVNNIVVPELQDLVGERGDKSWISYKSQIMHKLFEIDDAARKLMMNTLRSCYPVAMKKYRMMNWDDVRQAMKDGMEPGVHTYTHTSLLAMKDKQELDFEIGKAKSEMEYQLGKSIDIIAFPNGQYNDVVLSYCQSIGLSKMLLVNDEVMRTNAGNSDFMLVPRINMVNEPTYAMKLRIELFHSKLRKLRG